MKTIEKGYLHIYTGNGKGKTTAAFGLALRAAMAGKKVFIGQFVKSMRYHETEVESILPQIHTEQFGRGCFIGRNPADKKTARQGLDRCREALSGKEYDLVILDELNIALYFGLLTAGEVLEALHNRGEQVEAVVTGRYAPQELIDAADLITEMTEIKHYYQKGVESRDGIDR